MHRKYIIFLIGSIIIVSFFSFLYLNYTYYRPIELKNSKFQRGITYVAFDKDLLLKESEYDNIDMMLNLGADWVSIVPIWYQKTDSSINITEDDDLTPSDKSIIELIEYLHNKDKKILLKPLVDSYDETWRAEFEPTNWSLWFSSYQNFMLHYADIAQQEDIELFCVGCEYKSSDETHYYNWSKTIEGIRSIYKGSITYAADWSNYEDICFWDLVDYIGIDAYFPLYYHEFLIPSIQDLINGWNDALDDIEEWLEDSDFDDKKVIFTEVGYESQPKCWESPGYTGKVEVDINAQDMCYKALFSSIPDRSWIKGMFIWWWDNPSTHDVGGGLINNGWTPKGKPAEDTISNCYKSFNEKNPNDLDKIIGLILSFCILGTTIIFIIIIDKKSKR